MYQNGKSFKIVLQPEYRVMSISLIELLGMREPSADGTLKQGNLIKKRSHKFS